MQLFYGRERNGDKRVEGKGGEGVAACIETPKKRELFSLTTPSSNAVG